MLGYGAFSTREVLAVREYEIRRKLFSEFRKVSGYEFAPQTSEDVSKNEDFHDGDYIERAGNGKREIARPSDAGRILRAYPQFPGHFRGVSGRPYVAPFLLNNALRIEKERGADDSNVGFSVILLLADYAERIMERSVVGNEIDAEPAGIAEFRVTLFVVQGNSYDGDSRFLELLFQARKIAGFERAAGGIVLRIKVQKGRG